MATSIPLFDLRTGSAQEFAEALIDASCVFLVGHGIPAETRAGVFRTAREFFHLPVTAKEAVRWHGEGIWCGWQPPAAPDIVGDRTPDPVDRYEVHTLDGFRLWPERPSDLKPFWEDYYQRCTELTSRLMDFLIGELDLPAEQRDAWTTGQFSSLLANYYFEQPEARPDEHPRLAGHSDHGGLTLLAADDGPGGLEVRLPGSTEWRAVHIPPDALIVQAGDLLSRWTNRLIRGNVHRVVNPPRDLALTTRMSVVFFHHPSLDTEVAPAESCIARSGRPPLRPLNAGEHCMKRQESYKLTPTARAGDLDSLDGRELGQELFAAATGDPISLSPVDLIESGAS